MAILPLTYHPHNLLRTTMRTLTVDELTKPKTQKLIEAMIETMFAKNGVGIAANQVGHDLMLAIISTDEGPVAVANPVITRRSFRKETADEGCLSVPGVFGLVRRHRTVTMTGLDRTGKPIHITGHGLLARILQHEVDHLHGILCIDRMTKVVEGTLPDGRKKV